jgi:hypothetical protein
LRLITSLINYLDIGTAIYGIGDMLAKLGFLSEYGC